jgi:GT2 family glycosyltransferase
VSPEIAVVVPSHDRPLRLRWLLNALEEQTLADERWELVVAHDSTGSETEELLRSHPLAARGVLRHITFEPGPGPAVKRNAAWRATSAPAVAFTDDDCRPPADWVERALEAARANPGAIVQGTTRPDPDEAFLMHASPWSRSQEVDPPTPWAQTCNVVYERALLERLGGFDERLPVASAEDTDLALRARQGGAEVVAAPALLNYHAVEAVSLWKRLRSVWRWQHLAHLVKHHPEIRGELTLRLFWKRSHALLLLALAGAVLAPLMSPLALLAIVPWALAAAPRYGLGPRGLARSLSELPGRAALDAVEIAALARGSLRYRTLFL